MFCDLVGYTALSGRIDPEDLSKVLVAYREVVAEIVHRYDGFVPGHQGDGTLICFGYPTAHDDDATRSARAALDIVASVELLSARLQAVVGADLRVHVGIHTGEAVVGTTSDVGTIIGQVTNIAARLEGIASPGTILVSRETARFLQDAFDLEALEPLLLKGVSEPVPAHRLLREKREQGTLATFAGRRLTRLCGRDEELALLLKLWNRVIEGHGQVQLISGEPGIGKSRLLHALARRIPADTRTLHTCSCLQHHSHSALFPFVDLLRRELGFEPDETPADKLARLADAFESGRFPNPDMRDALASLLLLPVEHEPAVAETSPRVQRERIVGWFVQWLLGLADKRPVLLRIDDLHWADTYTLELLTELVKQAGRARILVVMSFRPHFVPPWGARADVGHVSLSRLSVAQARAFIDSLDSEAGLTAEARAQIERTANGVPLFIEELVKANLESIATGASGQPTVPIVLRGALAARLDRLGPEKALLEIASVIGREFSFELMRAVTGLDNAELKRQLDVLVDAELLYQRGFPPDARYDFKHVLLADAAYLSLLKTRRAAIHRAAAAAIVDLLPTLAEEHPEIVARHFREADDPVTAADYWRRAGTRALEQSADTHAVAHLKAALECLATMPEGEERARRELDCLIGLGAALTAVKGFGAPDVEETYARAYELCERLGGSEQRLTALAGLHSFYQVRGPLTRARDIAAQLLELARASGNKLWLAQAHRRLGWCLFCIGEMADGRRHLQTALSLYDETVSQNHARIHGAHPRVVGLVNLALVDWFMGDPDLALERSEEAIRLARKIGRPFILAYALCMSAAVRLCRKEPEGGLRLAREVVGLARTEGFPYWLAWGICLEGWGLAVRGSPREGMDKLLLGVQKYDSTGALLFLPWSRALLAACYRKVGDAQKATASQALALSEAAALGGYFFPLRVDDRQGGVESGWI